MGRKAVVKLIIATCALGMLNCMRMNGAYAADPFVGSRTMTLYGNPNIRNGFTLDAFTADFLVTTEDRLHYQIQAIAAGHDDPLSVSMVRSGSRLSQSPRPQGSASHSYMLAEGAVGAVLLMGQEVYDPEDISIYVAVWAPETTVRGSELAGDWEMISIDDSNVGSNPAEPFEMASETWSISDLGGNLVEVRLRKYDVTWQMQIVGNALVLLPETVETVPHPLHMRIVTDGLTLGAWFLGVEPDDDTDVSASIHLGTRRSNEPVGAKYAGGSGTAQDPYRIATVANLIALGETPEDYYKHFILTADIDLDPNLPGRKVFHEAVIAPKGTPDASEDLQGPRFTGVLDGKGHTISHLTITGGDWLGLFGRLDDAGSVCNLNLEAVEVSGGRYVGGLAGEHNGAGIVDCYCNGLVYGEEYVGGLVGANRWGASITGSSSNGVVSGYSRVGGLVGDNWRGTITGSSSTAAVDASDSAGGLVGANEGRITASYSTGEVWGYSQVGGLVGGNEDGRITTSSSSGSVTGTEGVGGLVGDNSYGGSITTSNSSGSISGDRYVGGLVGDNSWGGGITAGCSSGPVWGNTAVGGFVGNNYQGNITNCCSSGSVTGTEDVGGLVGDNYRGSIAMSYSTGLVTATGQHLRVGGFVGYNNEAGVTRGFWDTQTSGQVTSAGGTGKTTAEMQDPNTFVAAGWDFAGEVLDGICDYWQISPGEYPRLRWHAGDGPLMPEGQGTAEQPYLIRDARDLSTVWVDPMSHYRLTQSIDLSGLTWSMAVIPWFGGSFDGNGYVIRNLHIHGAGCLGLFGKLQSRAGIFNLGLEAVEIIGSGEDVGGLVGDNYRGSITDCHSSGSVKGNERVGGLVGFNGDSRESSIANCSSNGSVSGDRYVGGLLGYNFWGGNVTASRSSSAVSGAHDVGGLVGGSDWGHIADSYSTGAVTGTGFTAGGLVGDNLWGSIANCYSSSSVTGGEYVGGFLGRNYAGNIVTNHSTGPVSGTERVGGLVGDNFSASITNCFSTSSVRGTERVGGLVGDNSWSGSVAATYSSGSVHGDKYVGGLVGSNYHSSIAMSYSTGLVSGTEHVGGLVGDNDQGGITSSFWDSQTSGQAMSPGGAGKTTAEMRDIGELLSAGWDLVGEVSNGTCDYWQASPGDYPRLYYHGDDRPLMPEGLGTWEQPYMIRDARDLGTVWSKPMAHYRLAQSIDLSGITWSMAVVPWLGGGFDGNGCTMRNLHVHGAGSLGLFGRLHSNGGVSVSRLGLEAVEIDGIGDHVGALAGSSSWYGDIISCRSSGRVRGNESVGGLAGSNDYHCWITTSYSSASVLGEGSVGGLVGGNANYGKIVASYSCGAVRGTERVGGLVGDNDGGLTSSSFWDTQTSGQATSAGGIGKTTAQMQTAETFLGAGWDFVGETANGTEDIWWIDEGKGYPRLWEEWDDR